jgi:hypothetical protein
MVSNNIKNVPPISLLFLVLILLNFIFFKYLNNFCTACLKTTLVHTYLSRAFQYYQENGRRHDDLGNFKNTK